MSDRTASMTTVPTTASLSTKIIEGDLNVTGDYYQNGVPFGGGSGVTGGIQANKGGALAGIPGSSVDFVNGLTGLAPTGTGIGLTIKTDGHGSAGLEVLNANGSTATGFTTITAPSSGSPVLTVAGKTPSGTGEIVAKGFSSGGAPLSAVLNATPSQAKLSLNDADSGVISMTASAGDLTLLFEAGGVAGTCDLTLLDISGLEIDLQPALGIAPPQFTVATLPAGQEGYIAYATDGRKVGEGAGAGTGVVVYFSNGSWRVFSTDAAVAA